MRGSTRKSQELLDTPETLEEKATLDAVVSDRAGLTDAGFRGSGDGQRVPRVGTLLATRSATLPGAPRSPVHQLNMTVLRSPPAPRLACTADHRRCRRAPSSRWARSLPVLRNPPPGGELPLGDDKLLSKKRVLGDQFDATANEIRGQSENESKKSIMGRVLHCPRG